MKKNRCAFCALITAILLLLCSCAGDTTLSVHTGETSAQTEQSAASETTEEKTASSEPPSSATAPQGTETPVTDTPSDSHTSGNQPPRADYTPFFPEEKVIAFTFDDGPDWWTPMILDTIEGTEDKVTFFITGYMIDQAAEDGMDYTQFIKRAKKMGCEVGLHGYDHRNVYYESRNEEAPPEIYNHEIFDLTAKYKEITGEEPQLFRPVGGSFLHTKDYSFPIILWSVNSSDWATWEKYARDESGEIDYVNGLYANDPEIKAKVTEKAVDEIVENVLSQIKSGDIVLMHDVYDITRQAFARIYPILKEQGYRFVTVSELLGIVPEEHTGQYFYSTYFYGCLGNDVNLEKK